ncbi:substrate-binding domain-containing protein [Pseudaeromonas paramecii]|uniref:Periplasmic binding protein domain-containing protein n=1 Tax=Pseudaeromonas paramecii TaxID=2138166 RepID=A0ABP8Q9B3_9GAMM
MGWIRRYGLCCGLLLWWCSGAVLAECVGLVAGSGGKRFWSEVVMGAQLAGQDLGVKVHALLPMDEEDATQREAINRLVAMGCQGLVIAPSSAAREAHVSLLRKQGIATLYLDRDLPGERVAVVATNNGAAGELAAHRMAQALGRQGRVLLVRLKSGIPSTDARELGFARGAREAGLQLTYSPYLGLGVGEARSVLLRFLREAGRFDGVFSVNESTSLAVAAVLRDLGPTPAPLHIGFDLDPQLAQAIRDGRLYGVMVQQPRQLGYLAVQRLVDYLRGKRVEDHQLIPARFITAEELDRVENRALVAP